MLQKSSLTIYASPDFLPTTAGLLCGVPHLGCFWRDSRPEGFGQMWSAFEAELQFGRQRDCAVRAQIHLARIHFRAEMYVRLGIVSQGEL